MSERDITSHWKCFSVSKKAAQQPPRSHIYLMEFSQIHDKDLARVMKQFRVRIIYL